MGFETDLFISYAHLDNKPISPDEKGWISRFHASLQTILDTRMGENVAIWRDDKLRGNDIFDREIVDQFPKTALFISVVTPRYVKSEWCNKEINAFCQTAEENGGSSIDNKSRIVKVIKTPVDSLEPLPSVAQEVLGYEFYTRVGDAPVELDPVHDKEQSKPYRTKLAILAHEIAETLKTLKADGNSPTNETAPDLTVYLAHCGHDRQDDREQIKADLKAHGYAVVPDRRLPEDETGYIRTVEQLLGQCQLSIHLVGSSYGVVPDGSSKSQVVLQNELAVERAASDKLLRVISLPEGLVSKQEAQQKFINALHQDARMQLGADLITEDFEHVKGAIHAGLNKLETRKEQDHHERIEADEGDKLIYLVCIKQDRKATVPLRQYLNEQGLQVRIPAFEGAATEVREANGKLLKDCDGILVFYGAGDEAWKSTVDIDLRKAKVYRNGKPPLASYTYLADPGTDGKQDLIDTRERFLVNGLDGFSEAALEEFVEAVKAGIAV